MAIHGDKTQGQRIQALQRFKSGQINVLVATDVASRGIDIPKLKYVFNYNLPVEAESYIHRIGRTGRAGESGEAVTLCSADEIDLLADIEQLLGREITELKTEWSVDIERKSRKRRHDRSTGKGGRKFSRNRHERSFESKKISNSLKIKKDVRSEKNNRKSYNKKTSGKFIPKK